MWLCKSEGRNYILRTERQGTPGIKDEMTGKLTGMEKQATQKSRKQSTTLTLALWGKGDLDIQV
jgi:hypothetical protein